MKAHLPESCNSLPELRDNETSNIFGDGKTTNPLVAFSPKLNLLIRTPFEHLFPLATGST
jgi:hypothetical protein